MSHTAGADPEPPVPDAAQESLRIMVVDDHDLFRSGLRRLLDEQDGIAVVADARRGDEAVTLARDLRPDVVVMDVNMPGMTGVEATRRVLEASPRTAVVMLTVTHDDSAVIDAVIAGAAGYLLKDAHLPEIVRAIRAAAAGEAVIAAAVTINLLDRLRQQAPAAPPAPQAAFNLSPRELEVLRLVVAGCENSEIGKRLHLSASTIKHHVSNTLEKLSVNNRIQAAVLAVRLGLVDEPTRAQADVECESARSDRDCAAALPTPAAARSDRARTARAPWRSHAAGDRAPGRSCR